MTYNINKDKFLQFAMNKTETTMEDGRIFKVKQDDITYILDGDCKDEIMARNRYGDIKTLGFVYGGRFYSTYFNTSDFDLNFYHELNAFEDKYYADYEEAIRQYTIDNPVPVTDKAKEYNYMDKDFEDYCKYYVKEDARKELFGITYKNGRAYDNSKFAPIFFDCLIHPENYTSYIQNKIEEDANIINCKIKCDEEKRKVIENLKTDADIMYRLNMYQILNSIDGNNVKIFCSLYSENFELTIIRKSLMRSLAFEESISLNNFTSTVKYKIEQAAIRAGYKKYDAKLLCTDIKKISYGRKVLFEKED